MELLVKGHKVLIDDEDWPLVKEHKWTISKRANGRLYVIGYKKGSAGERGRNVYLHRWLLGEPSGLVDHRNRDGLDNRRSNLREASRGQNMANMAPHSDSAGRFKGVVFMSGRSKPWRARLVADGRQHHIGYFATEEEAARAYDAAALEAWGEFARLNFPSDHQKAA